MKQSANYSQRLKKFQKSLKNGQACLIEKPLDLFYLTGLQLSLGKLYITSLDAHLFVDGRYLQVSQESHTIPVSLPGLKEEKEFLKGCNSLIFDSVFTTYQRYEKLKELKQNLIPLPHPLKELKLVKSEHELQCMRKSAKVAWQGFKYIKKILKPGITEQEAVLEFEIFCKKQGAKELAFAPIIAFGPHTAMPHYHAGSAKLKKNDIALIDIGVVVDAYHSDMTRVLFLGHPNPALKKMYAIIKEAQKAALKICRAGVSVGKLDLAVRKVLAHEKMEQYFIHSLGHGIGLETHEPPRIKWNGEDKDLLLKANMVITIEPGIYIPGIGGVRYEDTIIITEDGYEPLYPEGEK